MKNFGTTSRFASLALVALVGTLMGAVISSAALADHGQGRGRGRGGEHCRTRCWYDSWGNRVCRTVCHGHHPGHGDDDLAAISSLGALTLLTSAADNAGQKQIVLRQATEDAAAYLESGRMTGVLPSLVQIAREEAARKVGAEMAAQLSEEDLVLSILESAEGLLEE